MKNLLLPAVLLMMSCFVLAQQNEKPNVLFIISDDLTTTAVSSYENKVCKTPNIDKLAQEGVRFTSAYCQFPVCGPSRASFMTGYYPSAIETYGYVSGRQAIGPDRKTWPQLFKDNGYYTARVSKIYHMGVPIDIETGSNGSDDAASWTERFNSQGPEWTAQGDGELVQNNPDGTLGVKGGNVMTIVKADGDDLVHSDGKTAQKACELIRLHKDKPFFLAVGFVRPHVPFVAPKSYFDPYPFADIQLPEKVDNDWADIPDKGINYVTTINAQMNEEQQKKAIAAYYASVAYMDAQVGKVLNTLKDKGLEDNTIVVFTSDHGFHLGEHDFWMKVSLKEESIRVPFIIKVPGKKPAVCHSFTELIDLYPTLAELAGLKYSPHIQGKSLVKTLDDPTLEVRDMAFSMSSRGGILFYTLRSRKWAYMQYGEDASYGMELFDMENDPKQFTNLAYKTEYANIVEDFKLKLKDKLKQVRYNDINGSSTSTGNILELKLDFEQNLSDQSGINRTIRTYDKQGTEDYTVVDFVNDTERGWVARFHQDTQYPETNGATGKGYLETAGWKGMATKPFSAAMWVKTIDDNQILIGWGGTEYGSCIAFNILDGKLRLEVIGGGVTGTTVINDGKWHHVAFVLDQNAINVDDVKLYVDGQLETHGVTNSYTINTILNSNVRIGADPRLHTHRVFWGYMDDVRIYSRSLSATEISDMNRTTTNIEEPVFPKDVKIIPGAGKIIFQSECEKPFIAEVYNLKGHLQKKQFIHNGTDTIAVQGGQTYIIKLIVEGQTVTEKVFIK